MEDLAKQHCVAVTAATPRLGEDQVRELSKQLQDWQVNEKEGEPRLEKRYVFKDFKQAMAFTNLVAEAANSEDHHPALLTEYGKVTVAWWTHKIKGLHLNDFIMAAKTDRLYP
jgi:4a-hydroxytetrahydrobiopterin dehydratase